MHLLQCGAAVALTICWFLPNLCSVYSKLIATTLMAFLATCAPSIICAVRYLQALLCNHLLVHAIEFLGGSCLSRIVSVLHCILCQLIACRGKALFQHTIKGTP